MRNHLRWLPLNLLLLAGILTLLGVAWRRDHRDASLPASAETARDAPSGNRCTTAAVIPYSVGASVVSAQPVAYGRRPGSQPHPDPFDVRDHDLLRASGWESLPCQSAIDLSDMGDAYVLLLSADDVALDSVQLRLDGAVITVMTQRRFHGGEFSFARSIMLPAAPDPAIAPHCSLTNGALRISLAKRRP
jgi:HSP20 family molecular chaperone IbpA